MHYTFYISRICNSYKHQAHSDQDQVHHIIFVQDGGMGLLPDT